MVFVDNPLFRAFDYSSACVLFYIQVVHQCVDGKLDVKGGMWIINFHDNELQCLDTRHLLSFFEVELASSQKIVDLYL